MRGHRNSETGRTMRGQKEGKEREREIYRTIVLLREEIEAVKGGGGNEGT